MKHRAVGSKSWTMTIVTVSAIFLISGCAARAVLRTEVPMPTTAFYATQNSQFLESYPPRMQNFGPGDVVCLVVDGYGGQTVTVSVADMLTGRTMGKETRYIPEGMRARYPFDLPSGSYIAEMGISGVGISSWKFSVNR